MLSSSAPHPSIQTSRYLGVPEISTGQGALLLEAVHLPQLDGLVGGGGGQLLGIWAEQALEDVLACTSGCAEKDCSASLGLNACGLAVFPLFWTMPHLPQTS